MIYSGLWECNGLVPQGTRASPWENKPWLTSWHRAVPAGKAHHFLIMHDTNRLTSAPGIMREPKYSSLCFFMFCKSSSMRLCYFCAKLKKNDIAYNQFLKGNWWKYEHWIFDDIKELLNMLVNIVVILLKASLAFRDASWNVCRWYDVWSYFKIIWGVAKWVGA